MTIGDEAFGGTITVNRLILVDGDFTNFLMIGRVLVVYM
jgi:hypothetical protein